MWMDNWVLNTPLEFWPAYKQEKLPILYRFFESKRKVVVLSSSNKPEIEANVEECEKQSIPILRRKGGGGTVVLGPGCLILTFAFYAKDVFGNSKYFHQINQMWIDALQPFVPVPLSQNGISDICCGEKKIAGTSIFRKKHLLVYQGSLLVDVDIETIGSFLKHPSREPDYRQGRSHSHFLTTLKTLGCSLSATELAEHCERYFNSNRKQYFGQDVHLPQLPFAPHENIFLK